MRKFIIVLFIIFNCQSFVFGQSISKDTVYSESYKSSLHSEIGKQYIIIIDTIRNIILEGVVLNGNRHGEWLEKKSDTLCKRYNFKNGKLHGPFIIYYSNSQPKLIRHYSNDLIEMDVYFYENGLLFKYLFYNTLTERVLPIDPHLNFEFNYVSEYRVYNEKGEIIANKLYPTLDSLRFTSAGCGDEFNILLVEIDDSCTFYQNSSFETGNPKLNIFRKGILDTVYFERFSLNGNLLIKGQFIYKCDESGTVCCWEKAGKWIYYKNEEEIYIR